MIEWSEPAWDPSWLVPSRLYHRGGFARDGAAVARLGEQAADGWRRDPPAPARDGAGAAWVLVGGAGFLGARIAALLLGEAGDAPVVIVSRTPDRIRAAWTAMADAAAADRLCRDPRLRLVAADIGAGTDWTHAVPQAAVVMHLAAAMHALADWDRLARVNLAGLRGSVALARRDGALLQLASTLSVFVSSNAARADDAAALPGTVDLWLHGGYAQTKAAAEQALAAAAPEHWQVVRYGLLVPEARRAFPDGHFAPAFARALSMAGALPNRAERAMVDLTPVDGAAAAAIRLARASGPRFVHRANPAAASLAQVLEALAALRGPLPVIGRAAWEERVARLPATARALLRSAFHKTDFLKGEAARGPMLNMDLFQSTHRRFVGGGLDMPPPETLLPGVAASMLRETT